MKGIPVEGPTVVVLNRGLEPFRERGGSHRCRNCASMAPGQVGSWMSGSNPQDDENVEARNARLLFDGQSLSCSLGQPRAR